LASEKVCHDVGLSHVKQEIVPQYKWAIELDESTITNAEIFDFICHRLRVKVYLELSATVLLLFLLVFSRDHKIIDYLFL
jgi:hypothetical protein